VKFLSEPSMLPARAQHELNQQSSCRAGAACRLKASAASAGAPQLPGPQLHQHHQQQQQQQQHTHDGGHGARNREAGSTRHTSHPEQPTHQRRGQHPNGASPQPEHRQPQALVQAIHGESHEGLVLGKSSNLELSGNYSIHGPAVITKSGGRLVAQVGACSGLPQCHLKRQVTMALRLGRAAAQVQAGEGRRWTMVSGSCCRRRQLPREALCP
jgi:hypothetical protein